MPPINAMEWIELAKLPVIPSVVVLFGDDEFLRCEALHRLEAGLQDDDEDLTRRVFSEKFEWRDVVAELATRSMFGGGRRLVVLEGAEKFVTANRDTLQSYFEKPYSSSVLVVEVNTFASNTNLFKIVDKSGLAIECKVPSRKAGKNSAPDEGAVRAWLGKRAIRHGAKLSDAAAKSLLELVDLEPGLLEQEVEKLSRLVGQGKSISPEFVHDHVGSWKVRSTWDLMDAACAGDAASAIEQLDRLILSGEEPVAMLGSIAYTLRRFAAATRMVEDAELAGRRLSVRDALAASGAHPGIVQKCEAQLMQINRRRAGQIYGWLLDLDRALKGESSSPRRARIALETLLVRLSGQARATSLPAKA